MPVKHWEIIKWHGSRKLEHPWVEEKNPVKNYEIEPGGMLKTEHIGLGNLFMHLLTPEEMNPGIGKPPLLEVFYEEYASGSAQESGDCTIPVFNFTEPPETLKEVIHPDLGGKIEIPPGLSFWPEDIVNIVILKLFHHKVKVYTEALIAAGRLNPDGSKPEPEKPPNVKSSPIDTEGLPGAPSTTENTNYPENPKVTVEVPTGTGVDEVTEIVPPPQGTPPPEVFTVEELFKKYRKLGAKMTDLQLFCDSLGVAKDTPMGKEGFVAAFTAFHKAQESGE